MAKRSIPVTLEFNDNFTGWMHLVAQAAHDLGVRLALMSATWEPHDWDDF